jgi:hypothetical protein
MREIHLLAAIFAALLCAPTPSAALGISPLQLDFWGEEPPPRSRALVEFDVNEWTAFIRGEAPDYALDGFGSDIDRLVAIDDLRSIRLAGVLGVHGLIRVPTRP